MTVYFLRHASAGQKKNNPAQDEKRPLDKDGVEQCHDIGLTLATLKVRVETIISSPLKRATATAVLVGEEIAYDSKVVIDGALRPDASFEDFRKLLARYSKQDAIVVIGHNPNFSQFLSLLICGSAEDAVELKKGAVARVDYDGKGSGSLSWCITPKLVRAIYASAASKSRPKTVRK